MANLGLHTGGLPRGELLGRYRTYEDAQKVVDHLASAEGLDLKAITIVGNDLRSVEKVRGRLSYPRVALTGAVQGALFGAFIGLLLMLFTPEGMVLVNFGMAVLMGMAIWMIIGVISFSARRGARSFISVSQLTATTFDVVCDFQVAGKARQLVAKAGVSSLNALNDPTGKSTNLDAAARRESATSAQSTQSSTPNDPSAPRPGLGSPDSSTTPPSDTDSDPASGTTPSGEGSSPTYGEQREGGEPASSFEGAGAASQKEWAQPDGKPRYGVRLSDVQKPEPAEPEQTEDDDATRPEVSDETRGEPSSR
ncbi:general stress protein [Nesterenkonia ebinurensis]|uniref:general stress protein n=1 Tax=Nesterenkonia ebinurensis TaxID=2608252 RepID=UPI00123D48D0|nr:general stress protein [Nesterenkonia ebinurensis]